jgi:hypothetical protein
MATGSDVKDALRNMAQLYGRELSPAASQMLIEDLKEYSPDEILHALQACRRELRGFPTVADIVGRIQAQDGRPGPDEAWAMIPQDEYGSVVWTEEMAAAFGVAAPLLRSGDAIAARTTFREKYQALVKEARDRGAPPKWTPSFGMDPHGRVAAVRKALDGGRLSLADASHALPELAFTSSAPALPCPDAEVEADPIETKQRNRALLASITKPMPDPDETDERQE